MVGRRIGATYSDGNIATFGDDVPIGFKAYEANRIERTSRVQQESPDNSWTKYDPDPAWVFGHDPMTTPLRT